MSSRMIEIEGHIIDSLILPQIFEIVMDMGGDFEVKDFKIGRFKHETSYAKLEIKSPDDELLDSILVRLRDVGVSVIKEDEARCEPAPGDGVYPDSFYSTTNLDTSVKYNGRWIEVENPEMDCAICIEEEPLRAYTVTLNGVKKGDMIVCGHSGVRVTRPERPRSKDVFEFMASSVSSEKPKEKLIAQIAAQMRSVKEEGGKILLVGGPAIIHTGAGKYLSCLIRNEYINTLFGGNALAVHDLEYAIYGTSLGIYLDKGIPSDRGHEHHLRAINTIRKYGSIKAAIEAGVVKKGVMYEAVMKGIDYVLAGSIRDDGPLPEIETDSVKAQQKMRELVPGTKLVIMLASALHSIATGNILPASVRLVTVDINPAIVTKLMDRGSFQSLGIVTDVQSFLRELCHCLELVV
ncbi:MAG: TIGR00300 family protein [Chloroflexi bacterium]|nr:TIGR00300 family protein [Chloroflexota bacterium]